MDSINFKKWAFHFMIWILIIKVITLYLTSNNTSIFHSGNNTAEAYFYFGILETVLLLLCLIFIIISSIKKEKKNYQYWISIVGLVSIGILPTILFLSLNYFKEYLN